MITKEGKVPPARFELTAPGLGILCSILLSYGGVTDNFYLFAFYSVIISTNLMRAITAIALLISTEFLSGCGTTNPLLIKLYHPKTNVVRNCAARESNSRNTQMLTDIVESCARQLEAHGFVRVDESFVPPSSALKSTPALTEQSPR
jgi:hypothetical protein